MQYFGKDTGNYLPASITLYVEVTFLEDMVSNEAVLRYMRSFKPTLEMSRYLGQAYFVDMQRNVSRHLVAEEGISLHNQPY